VSVSILRASRVYDLRIVAAEGANDGERDLVAIDFAVRNGEFVLPLAQVAGETGRPVAVM
jgi:hypothetical protein